MELGRNITFGRYLAVDSPVHRRNAAYKVLCWLVFAVGLFLAGGFTVLLVLAAALVAVVVAARIPLGYLVRGLRPMLPFLLVLYVLQVLFSKSLYPQSQDVWWSWGILSITGEGVSGATQVTLRVVVLFLSVTLLTLSTTVISLVDAMERLSSPLRAIGVPTGELALAFAIAMRFVPTLVTEAERLITAQASRGAGTDARNPVRRLRARLPVLVPLMLATLDRGDDLTEAMHARCYRGGAGRTRWRVVTVAAADRFALLGMVILVGVLLALRYGYRLP